MTQNFTFTIKKTRLDENYHPSDNTRITTNFANLARGEHRQQNLRGVLHMIDRRFNDLACWDNPTGDRYSVELEIISADIKMESTSDTIPSIEVLKTYIVDRKTDQRIEGIVGNNFSSYVRDYDFSVRLLIIIKANRNSLSQKILAFCMAAYLSHSLTQKVTNKTSRNHR